MIREEFEGPLTPEDLEWLEARLPQSRIDRLVEVHGLAGEEPQPSGVAEGGDPGNEGLENDGVAEGEDPSNEGLENDGDGLEDLIGSPTQPVFEPSDHTENEIIAYLAGNPGERERVLALEAEGRRRKGVLAL